MNRFVFLIFLFSTSSQAHKLSGEVSLQNRYYTEQGDFGNTDQSELNLRLKPQYDHGWDQDRKVIQVIPFLRLSDPDREKTAFDTREASFVGSWDKWELRVGISKVYWGVTESFHLTDIINQVDFVEDVDREERLGQPMLNPTYVSDYGNISLFVLPFFRERTFSGEEGRFRQALLIDTDRAIYEHASGQQHVDVALRWSHYIGNIDWAVSHFHGTDREPLFLTETVGGVTSLRPFYVLTDQTTLELQGIFGEWLLKFEGLYKDSSQVDPFFAAVAGFEYTFTNVFGGRDIGVLLEHLYDDRRLDSDFGFYSHWFVASRLAWNDEQAFELLGGGFFNGEEGLLTSLRLEASRRINDVWKWELEVNAIVDAADGEFLRTFENDDYAQLNISYFF